MKFTKEHRAKLSAAAKARYAKKPKKRDRKPGVKVGPYKKRNKPMTLANYSKRILKPSIKKFKKRNKPSTKTLDHYSDLFKNTENMKIGDTLRIRLPKDYVATDGPNIPEYTPSQPLTLCGQLEDSILLLENRISNAIAKINSLM